jgi:hypothetical protein
MDMNADKRAVELTRREALEMFGMGVTAAAVPRIASAEPSFPEGAVIRTILKDYPPAELGGGATRNNEQTTAPEPHTEGGALCHQGRSLPQFLQHPEATLEP